MGHVAQRAPTAFGMAESDTSISRAAAGKSTQSTRLAVIEEAGAGKI